jgi:hypothetical protein
LHACRKLLEAVRELGSVGNGLRGVPRGSALGRNGTEAVPYRYPPYLESLGRLVAQ